jgi:uncharacterized protein involved in response to NO
MAAPVLVAEQPAASPSGRIALFEKGFRPFFLGAGLFAVAIVPIWLLVFSGVAPSVAYLDRTAWHAHEMIFGFVIAVMAGFLLTAVANWTQRETVVGVRLAGLFLLWAAGRASMLLAGALPRGLAASVDLAFLPVLVFSLARPLWAAKSRRNFLLVGVLSALFMVNLAMHLSALGLVAPSVARRAALAGVDLVLLVVSIIAGRVVPLFTRNATRVAAIRSIPAFDALALAAMAVLSALDLVVPDTLAASVAAGVAGVLAAARAARWGLQHSSREPLLWVLHIGYSWMVVGLLLRAFSSIGFPSSLATHALTVGVMGTLTLGMMARVSLGHTGRPLVAPRAATWAFVSISLAAVARVLVPLLWPAWFVPILCVAGALWMLAFALFVIVYAPSLTRSRLDGRPG